VLGDARDLWGRGTHLRGCNESKTLWLRQCDILTSEREREGYTFEWMYLVRVQAHEKEGEREGEREEWMLNY
jgi:hypothetical protein